jgi:hypothetical protein
VVKRMVVNWIIFVLCPGEMGKDISIRSTEQMINSVWEQDSVLSEVKIFH